MVNVGYCKYLEADQFCKYLGKNGVFVRYLLCELPEAYIAEGQVRSFVFRQFSQHLKAF